MAFHKCSVWNDLCVNEVLQRVNSTHDTNVSKWLPVSVILMPFVCQSFKNLYSCSSFSDGNGISQDETTSNWENKTHKTKEKKVPWAAPAATGCHTGIICLWFGYKTVIYDITAIALPYLRPPNNNNCWSRNTFSVTSANKQTVERPLYKVCDDINVYRYTVLLCLILKLHMVAFRSSRNIESLHLSKIDEMPTS